MLEDESASRKAGGKTQRKKSKISRMSRSILVQSSRIENADVMFRLEIFDITSSARASQGSSVAVGDIRKMCPQLPVRLQDVKDPPSHSTAR